MSHGTFDPLSIISRLNTAKVMSYDVIYMQPRITYIKNINRAILANLQHRPSKLGQLIGLDDTHLQVEKCCSHGNSLFSSPHPLDFNMLVIFSSQKIKQGHKLKLR